ncbi:MAG: DUF4062 domain-containing protein [Isosphaeraceae bacterium]
MSSVMRGLEVARESAVRAARSLRHEVKRAEDFGASPASPQQTCLAGVRWAEVVLLILGGRYGEPQQSGLSPTHEEYREAKDRCSVLAFIQEGVEREPAQDRFVAEVRDWESGYYTASFSTPEELHDEVVRALHELELAHATGPLDENEMLERARAMIPAERHASDATLAVAIAGGPRQQVLRPTELEAPDLDRAMQQAALFGDAPVLDRSLGTRVQRRGDFLLLEQDRGSVLIDQMGSIRIVMPARAERTGARYELPVIIEEEVSERLQRALRFAGWALDHVDRVRRISDVVPVAGLHRGGCGWRTRAEQEASPTSMQFPQGPDPVLVHLFPARRHRAALSQDAAALAEDLKVLLRREALGNR